MKYVCLAKNLLNTAHWFENGHYLYITGRYEPRWKGNDNYELKINTIKLLSEIMEERAKKLTISIPLEGIDDNLIRKIKNLQTPANTGKGRGKGKNKSAPKTGLYVRVRDSKNKDVLELFSKTIRLSPDKKVFEKLDAMKDEGVRYKLN